MSFKSKLSEFRNSVFRKTPKAINAVPDIFEALDARIDELQNLVNALTNAGSALSDARARVDNSGGGLLLPFSGPFDFKRDTINQDYVLQMNAANTVIRFEARAGSGNSAGAGTDRAELVAQYTASDHHNTVPWGQECWSAFSTRIEGGVSLNSSDFLLFWQMHGVQEPGEFSASPPLALNFSGKSFRVTTRWDANATQTSGSDYHTTSYAYDENFALGKWDNWVIRMKFGFSNDAILQVWRNGTLIVDKTSNFNMGFNDTYGPRPQFGIYRSQNYTGTAVVYHANTEFSYSSLADRITSPRAIPAGIPPASDLLLTSAAIVSNSTPPTISGSTVLGQTLTATNGTWTGSPTNFSYQWKANGTNISGATTPTFSLLSAQIGKTITVTVTASNGTSSATSTSVQTGTVTETVPENLTIALVGSSSPDQYATLSSGTSSANVTSSTNGTAFTVMTAGRFAMDAGAAIATATSKSVRWLRGGASGTTLAQWEASGSTYRANVVNMIKAAGCDYVLLQVGSNDTVQGIITSTASHAAMLRSLISKIRTETGIPDLRIILGASQDRSDAALEQIRFAREAEIQVSDDENVRLGFQTYDLETSDGIHQTPTAQGISAQRFTAQLLSWVNNGAFWRGPAITSVSGISDTITDVFIVHIQGTDFTPTSGITGFVLKNSAGTALSISSAARVTPNKIRLTHASKGANAGSLIYMPNGVLTDNATVVRDNSALTLPLEVSSQVWTVGATAVTP